MTDSAHTSNPPALDDLAPRQIVEALDRYVVGQRSEERRVGKECRL